MDKYLFFSFNQNKIKEIKNLFSKSDISLYSPDSLGINTEPIENGKTFVDNAKIKSEYGFKASKIACFSDDSGICIDAMKNMPGVKSKRFIDKFKDKEDCFNFIINKVKKNKNSYAYFKTSICLTFGNNYNLFFEGKLEGRISEKPYGKNGFGYDPIFIPMGYEITLAEMNLNEKNIISHRSIAIQKLLNFITT